MNRPSKEQLIETIKNGCDEQNNTLYLRKNGEFFLYDINDLFKNENIDCVGFYETFTMGNDYVGKEASKSENFINTIYQAFLYAWINYKETNIKNQYLGDCYCIHSIEELEKRIDNL